MDLISNMAVIGNQNPDFLTDKIDLFYAGEEDLAIERRGKKPFVYSMNGQAYDDRIRLTEISKLAVPPAWENVRIATAANAHLQAIGRDAKHRKQYRYHPKWQRFRNRTKFAKLLLFGEHLPKIRKQVEKDLTDDYWSKEKVLALIIKLMEETHIRIGNEQYAKHNQTYGLTTLRKRHLAHADRNLRFEFVGKRGKAHRITLRSKRLIQLVNQCEEIPGWELFKFFDEDGNKHSVESGMVNEYIQKHSGSLFSAKDFRTWAASLVFYKHLKSLELKNVERDPQVKVRQALKEAAKALGNTMNVCRKYYVHPALIVEYEKQPERILHQEKIARMPFIQETEIEMMNFIKLSDYKILNEA